MPKKHQASNEKTRYCQKKRDDENIIDEISNAVEKFLLINEIEAVAQPTFDPFTHAKCHYIDPSTNVICGKICKKKQRIKHSQSLSHKTLKQIIIKQKYKLTSNKFLTLYLVIFLL